MHQTSLAGFEEIHHKGTQATIPAGDGPDHPLVWVDPGTETQLSRPERPRMPAEGFGAGAAHRLRATLVQSVCPWHGEVLYDSQVMRDLAGIDLGKEAEPDETTILNFRNLLEAKNMGRQTVATGQGISE